MSVQMMMAGLAAAAFATGGIGAKPMLTAGAAVSSTPAQKPTSAKTKYCVLDFATGSRIPRKTCRTREAWLAEGFDPLASKS